jgi:hypothetical protein
MNTGDLVKVVKLVDEQGNRDLLHCTGRVIGFINDDCGSTPKDPMVKVSFRGEKVDAFWKEELEPV